MKYCIDCIHYYCKKAHPAKRPIEADNNLYGTKRCWLKYHIKKDYEGSETIEETEDTDHISNENYNCKSYANKHKEILYLFIPASVILTIIYWYSV